MPQIGATVTNLVTRSESVFSGSVIDDANTPTSFRAACTSFSMTREVMTCSGKQHISWVSVQAVSSTAHRYRPWLLVSRRRRHYDSGAHREKTCRSGWRFRVAQRPRSTGSGRTLGMASSSFHDDAGRQTSAPSCLVCRKTGELRLISAMPMVRCLFVVRRPTISETRCWAFARANLVMIGERLCAQATP